MYGVAGCGRSRVVLRPAGDRRRRQPRRCPGCRRSAGTRRMHPYSGPRWWPALLLARGSPRPPPSRRTCCSAAATSAPGCGRPARARPARTRAVARRSGCAWRLQRGASCGWTGWVAPDRGSPTARSATTSDLIGDSSTLPGRVRAGAAVILVDGVLRRGGRDARAGRRGIHGLVGAAAARRGGRRSGRDAAGDRPVPSALAVGPRRHHRGRALRRAAAAVALGWAWASRWSPVTARGSGPSSSAPWGTCAPTLVLSRSRPVAVRRGAPRCRLSPGPALAFGVVVLFFGPLLQAAGMGPGPLAVPSPGSWCPRSRSGGHPSWCCWRSRPA